MLRLTFEKDEVHQLEHVLQRAGTLTDISALPLRRCEDIVKEVNQLISTKLMRQNNTSPRIRRRLWLKQKGHVVRLHQDLERARKAFSEAMNVDIR
jgi:hypothetical protein